MILIDGTNLAYNEYMQALHYSARQAYTPQHAWEVNDGLSRPPGRFPSLEFSHSFSQASEGRHLFLRLLSKDFPSFDGFFLKLGLDGLRIIGLSTPIRGKGPWLSPPRCHKTWHLVSRDASPSQAGPASIPSGGGQAVHG